MSTPNTTPRRAGARTAKPCIRSSYPKYGFPGAIEFATKDSTGTIYPPSGTEPHLWWGYETLVSKDGRRWNNTTSRYATDDFGNLVRVAA